MKIDHSLTYIKRDPKNIPHKIRLKNLIRIIGREMRGIDISTLGYADFGCSNGYLTNYFSRMFHFKESFGFDHNLDNLKIAEERYPDIRFDFFDLGNIDSRTEEFDIVTCFETVEHVGNLGNALRNLVRSVRPGSGLLLLTVPIEIGLWGVMKFIMKKFFYGYSLDELPNVTISAYFGALVRGKRVSAFRDKRASWATHFGFDYRDIDEILDCLEAEYRAINQFTTRYYLIRKPLPD